MLLALGLFAASGAASVLGLMALGAIAVFIGVSLLSNRLVPPIASAIGWPLERLRGVAGRLARENAERNPTRTAVTAAALMIGLALVTFVTVLAAGLRASINDTVDKNFAGDLVLLNQDSFSPIPSEAGRAVAADPGRRLRLSDQRERRPRQGRLREHERERASTRRPSRRRGRPR